MVTNVMVWLIIINYIIPTLPSMIFFFLQRHANSLFSCMSEIDIQFYYPTGTQNLYKFKNKNTNLIK